MITRGEKKALMRRELQDLLVNDQNYVSQDELFNYLDRKSYKLFDRAVAEQLYERLNKDQRGFISIEEFIIVYLEAEEILKNKIENSKRYLQDYHRQRKEAEIKYNDIKRYEKLNSYGIMEDSNLSIHVCEAENLETQYGKSNYFITIICGDQKKESGIGEYGEVYGWKDKFTFAIDTGMEDVSIILSEFDKFSHQAVVGELSIPLNRCRDQYTHDDWHELWKNGQATPVRLRINLQWIYSKVRYLQDVIKKWEEHINDQENDLVDYQKDLKTLYYPFPSVAKEMVTESYYPQKQGTSNFDPNREFNRYYTYHDDLFLGLKYIMIFWMIFSLFIMFQRTMFLDLFIIQVYSVFYVKVTLDKKRSFFLMILVIFTFILDIPWLFIYTKTYWTGLENEMTGSTEIDNGQSRMVIIFSYFVCILKFILLIVLWFVTQRFHRYGDEFDLRQTRPQDFLYLNHSDRSPINYNRYNQSSPALINKTPSQHQIIYAQPFNTVQPVQQNFQSTTIQQTPASFYQSQNYNLPHLATTVVRPPTFN